MGQTRVCQGNTGFAQMLRLWFSGFAALSYSWESSCNFTQMVIWCALWSCCLGCFCLRGYYSYFFPTSSIKKSLQTIYVLTFYLVQNQLKSLGYEIFFDHSQPSQILPPLNLDRIARHSHTVLFQLNMSMLFDNFFCVLLVQNGKLYLQAKAVLYHIAVHKLGCNGCLTDTWWYQD